ncbi:hypothetical protein BCR34DRAFT_564355 [Clohesyomyces aquaticus]|uniref:Uncharacterized protein n=1 Tax=Clohesyomyces aquaticus TaxID=1231657 RepID=A0A1Y1ZP35_9PLEO|nr:hypothetical protein BCR34DRAFT_564355 [Clohesyomyces aquaticus]
MFLPTANALVQREVPNEACRVQPLRSAVHQCETTRARFVSLARPAFCFSAWSFNRHPRSRESGFGPASEGSDGKRTLFLIGSARELVVSLLASSFAIFPNGLLMRTLSTSIGFGSLYYIHKPTDWLVWLEHCWSGKHLDVLHCGWGNEVSDMCTNKGHPGRLSAWPKSSKSVSPAGIVVSPLIPKHLPVSVGWLRSYLAHGRLRLPKITQSASSTHDLDTKSSGRSNLQDEMSDLVEKPAPLWQVRRTMIF